jgi:hypothetical protein
MKPFLSRDALVGGERRALKGLLRSLLQKEEKLVVWLK